jgi:hypothetical protein
MTSANALPKQPRSQEPGWSSKLVRDRLARLFVEAEHCPHVMARILDVLRESATAPLTISARRGDRFYVIEIDVDRMNDRPAQALLQKLRRIMAVRRAEWSAFNPRG